MMLLGLLPRFFSALGLMLLIFVGGCTSLGGSIFDDLLTSDDSPPSSGVPQESPNLSTATIGRNPNAVSGRVNVRNPLAEYCPRVLIRSGTESYRTYPDGIEDRVASNVLHQATITEVARECRYIGDNLHISIGARGRVITGPLGLPGRVPLPILVTVREDSCFHYSKLHSRVVEVLPNETAAYFSFVDPNVVFPAPTDTNILLYIGFVSDDPLPEVDRCELAPSRPITSLY